jgi:sortase family protein
VGATPEQRARTAIAVTTALVVALVVVAGAVVWLTRSDDGGQPSAGSGAKVRAEASSPAPSVTSSSAPPTCAEATHAFRPRRVTVPGVTRDALVVTPPRDANGVPGAPPLTTSGKTEFAWDRMQHVRPGDSAGNVLLNAHTWPDGSALGNRLLSSLQHGDRIVVQGDTARLCYRVTERVEVLASRGLKRYYATDGPPQLAIVVCSGRRLGPGVWTKRTIWFASPAA